MTFFFGGVPLDSRYDFLLFIPALVAVVFFEGNFRRSLSLDHVS